MQGGCGTKEVSAGWAWHKGGQCRVGVAQRRSVQGGRGTKEVSVGWAWHRGGQCRVGAAREGSNYLQAGNETLL